MNSITVTILCLAVAMVSSYPAGYNVPAAPVQYEPYEDRDYKFGYAIQDAASYNQQTREESKYGNTVKGQYTVLEPTGHLRVVNYIADDNGFRAEVQNKPGYSNYQAPAAAPAPVKAPTYAFRH